MSHYHTGYADGAAVERGEKGEYNEQLFTDPGYRNGLRDGRAAEIDKRLAAGDMAHDALDDYFARHMDRITALIGERVSDGQLAQVADVLTEAMNDSYRIDRN